MSVMVLAPQHLAKSRGVYEQYLPNYSKIDNYLDTTNQRQIRFWYLAGSVA